MAQLVAHLHGMQGVRGSSPLISTIYRLVQKDWAVFYYFSNSTWCFHMNVPLARNSICPLHEIIVRRDKRGMAITPNNTFKNLAKILKKSLKNVLLPPGKRGGIHLIESSYVGAHDRLLS